MRRRHAGDHANTRSSIERGALDELFAAKYEELRRIASTLKSGDGSLTLSPTALVNEAWVRLSGSPALGGLSPAHFKAIAARAMRRILIDAARARKARKRSGGTDVVMIAVDESVEQQLIREDDVLGLDAALEDLARLEPRQAEIVEGRYFGGLTVAELADVLQVSDTTIERDWRVAKAWLKTQLQK
jgi:RNA polymerase sigma factor (TIGR02999 family)